MTLIEVLLVVTILLVIASAVVPRLVNRQEKGHKIEGKKPSFVEDLVFLLIGPIFVSIEFASKLGLPVPYAQRSHGKDHTEGQIQGH